MLITIDTNHPTQLDIDLLKVMLSGYLTAEPEPAPLPGDTPATSEPDKPKRTRRTKAQIAADEAAEAAQNLSDALDGKTEEPTDEGELKETPSLEAVTELATQLIASDRAAMVDLLQQYAPDGGPKRVSNVPADKLAEFADAIRAKLA